MNRNHIILALASLLIACTAVTPALAACDTALLVVDMQNYYLSNSILVNVDRLAVLPRVAATIEAARSEGVHVIYAKNLDPRFSETDEALDFPELIKPIEGDIVFTKTDPDAFLNTTLEATLKSLGISRLLICGVWSTCCIKGTMDAVQGTEREIIVVADAHGDALMRTSEIKQWNETWDAWENVSVVRLADIDFAGFCP